MNSNIKDKVISTGKGAEGKKHQAFAMELSRLKAAKKTCSETKNCVEYTKLGGDFRFNQIERVVEVPKKTDEMRRKIQKETNPNNTYQKEESPTEVKIPSTSRASNHDGGEKHKILNNSQALSEEIHKINYLIEQINNNKKIKI